MSTSLYSMKTVFRQPLTWVAVLLFLLGLFIGGLGYWQSTHARLLAREGVETTATVIDRRVESRVNSNGRRQESYVLAVRFQTAAGATQESSIRVSRAVFDAAATNTSLPLRYAASDPAITELEAGDTARTAWIFEGMGALLGAGGLLAAFFARRALASQRRAADGERRQATVRAHHQSGKARANTATAEWSDGTLTGRTGARKREALPGIGTQIAIRIDPVTGKGWWEGDY